MAVLMAVAVAVDKFDDKSNSPPACQNIGHSIPNQRVSVADGEFGGGGSVDGGGSCGWLPATAMSVLMVDGDG